MPRILRAGVFSNDVALSDRKGQLHDVVFDENYLSMHTNDEFSKSPFIETCVVHSDPLNQNVGSTPETHLNLELLYQPRWLSILHVIKLERF